MENERIYNNIQIIIDYERLSSKAFIGQQREEEEEEDLGRVGTREQNQACKDDKWKNDNHRRRNKRIN